MTPDFESGEMLLIFKPLRWSSFDVVSKIRNLIRNRTGLKKIKVGHAGTLDPLADGLLIIMTGKFTKRIDEFQEMEKEYTGEFYLGKTTPSYDLEHEVNASFPTDHITEDLLRETVSRFTGTFEQIPPVYSAVKVEGRRAYKYARNQEDVVIKSRTITIREFELTRIAFPVVEFRIVCSKGTYIRSLARDFGEAIHSGAYIQRLRRTRIGDFTIDKALHEEDWAPFILTEGIVTA